MSFRLLAGALAPALVSFLLVSCSSEKTSPPGTAADAGLPASNQPSTATLFSKAITSVTIEIDYAPGAEPYQGSVEKLGDPWRLFQTTSEAVFDGKKTVSFPRTLAKMEKLDDVPAKNFSNKDILQVAAAHRTEPQYEDSVSFYVVFLDGYWLDETGAEQKDVLGVSIPNTGVIGMFKPAIAAPATNPTPPLPIVEQVALIHFFGHAVGFVDSGITVETANRAHVDADDGHHCNVKQCVMSAGVERAAGGGAAARLVSNPDSVLIGQECLSDARIFENKIVAK